MLNIPQISLDKSFSDLSDFRCFYKFQSFQTFFLIISEVVLYIGDYSVVDIWWIEKYSLEYIFPAQKELYTKS